MFVFNVPQLRYSTAISSAGVRGRGRQNPSAAPTRRHRRSRRPSRQRSCECAADAARNAFRNSTPLKLFRFASIATFFNFAPAPQRSRSPGDLNPAETRVRQAKDHAPKTAIAHQQIRAAAQITKRGGPAHAQNSPPRPNPLPTPVRHTGPPGRQRAAWCASPAVRYGGSTVSRETRTGQFAGNINLGGCG